MADYVSKPISPPAILDRLLHHSERLSTNGPSYRLKDRFDLVTAGEPMP